MHETSWSLGTLVGFPIMILIVIGFLIGSFLVFRWMRNNPDDPDYGMGKLFAFGLLGCAVLMAITIAIGMYPYKAEYHQWETRGGEVVKIDSRLLDGANQKFVVTFANGDQLGCNDTRCAAIEEGDVLWLSCKRTWQYAGTDGYDCNFVEARRP